jgi:uncharacterized protein (TIGR02646 family)
VIRLDRGRASAPLALLTDGPTERDQVIRPKATASPPTLESKDFKGAVYGSKAVKEALWEMQDGKCCFCEKEVEVAFGTVEHFRPKTSAREDDGSTRPGYWWLGYEFENLYLCCSNCNTPKGNYFPLRSGSSPLAVDALPSQAVPKEAALVLEADGRHGPREGDGTRRQARRAGRAHQVPRASLPQVPRSPHREAPRGAAVGRRGRPSAGARRRAVARGARARLAVRRDDPRGAAAGRHPLSSRSGVTIAARVELGA